MIRKCASKDMGKSNLGWLNSLFHFSFAEYYNPNNMNFGVLRVINDDLIDAQTGFDTHPHKNMEIISYVVDGTLTHQDSMGNQSTLSRGNVQYMSAGTGIFHSEHNLGNETLRLLQIWILPDQPNLTPNYGEYLFDWEERMGKWLHIVSGPTGNAPIHIHQDANLYVLALEKGETLSFPVQQGRQAYLVQIEGTSTANDIFLEPQDAVEIVEEAIQLSTTDASHYLLIEMKKEQ